jgi:hypothetical protein
MNETIATHWNKKWPELPGFDCIVYANGDVTVLDCYSLTDSQTNKRELFCRPRCDTTIESLEKYDAADWTSSDEWTRIEHEGKIYIGGDGGMGNMGFIAHIDGAGGLIWAIFLWDSNPIRELAVKGNLLSAVNEHSVLRVEINLDKLTEISIHIISSP